MTKVNLLVLTILILFVLGMIWFGYAIIKYEYEYENTKKELCISQGFTYVETENGINVRDCYSIDNGIVQFYNLYNINGTNRLVKGVR